MVIYLAGETEEQEARLDEMTPRQIVAELDKHVVGQKAAKRAVAIALRNRVRRKKLPPDLAADVIPKNIIMIGCRTYNRSNERTKLQIGSINL